MMRRTVRVHQWSVLLAIAGCAGESSDAEFRSLEEVDIGVDTDDSFGGSGSMTAGGTTWGGDTSSDGGGSGSFSTSIGSSMSGGEATSLTSDDGSTSWTSVGDSTDDGSSDGGDTGSDECSTDEDCPLPDD